MKPARCKASKQPRIPIKLVLTVINLEAGTPLTDEGIHRGRNKSKTLPLPICFLAPTHSIIMETRTALVTGGNRGIGRCCVIALAEVDNIKDIIFTSRAVEAGQKAKEEIQQLIGDKATSTQPTDVV
jgi:hypothetical protein